MNYTDAITYLKENEIKKEDGSYYEFGEDIPEAPERAMTDKINRVSIVALVIPSGSIGVGMIPPSRHDTTL